MENIDYVVIAIILILLISIGLSIQQQDVKINEIRLLVENITIGKI